MAYTPPSNQQEIFRMVIDPTLHHEAEAFARSLAKDYPSGYRVAKHHHMEGQLIYAVAGIMELITEDGLRLIPPQRGIWMPAKVEHSMRARGCVSLRTLYIQSDSTLKLLPPAPKSLIVSPLLRELILRLATTPELRRSDSKHAQLMSLLLDEIEWSGESALPLPPIRDPRLQHICFAILDNPADKRGLTAWAHQVGASSRTLARLFQQELGVPYRYWRQQVCAMSALPRLGAGEPITLIAADLGYETPGAFSSMFRRVMHTTPSQYFQ